MLNDKFLYQMIIFTPNDDC